ncbi:MAG: hypothetical protein AABZ57_00790, partial [Candidatus Margulisiibacteriota bacterium]
IRGGGIHIYGGTLKGDRFLDTDVDIDAIRRNELRKKIRYKGKSFFISGAYGCQKEEFGTAFTLFLMDKTLFPLQAMTSEVFELKDLPGVINSMASGETDYPGKVIVKNTVEK